MSSTGAGKGDKVRPHDKEKYNAGYDRIFGGDRRKEWKYIEWEQCPCCGNSLEVLTNCGQVEGVQHFYDGDVVRCVSHSLSTDCEASNLQIVVEEDRGAWVNGEW